MSVLWRSCYHHWVLVKNLDNWVDYYNNERTHKGKVCNGKTPMKALFSGKGIGYSKNLNQLWQIPNQFGNCTIVSGELVRHILTYWYIDKDRGGQNDENQNNDFNFFIWADLFSADQSICWSCSRHRFQYRFSCGSCSRRGTKHQDRKSVV